MKKKMSLLTLIGVTVAFFGSVRSVPEVADTGWAMIVYMLIAAIGFALPIALISAELSTAFPSGGGAPLWVTKAFGDKWGFVTSWLLWVQLFFGMAMVGSTLAALFGYTIKQDTLGESPMAVLIILLVVYWAMTFLNMKFDMTKLQGSYGAIVGIYIPFVVIIILGIMYFAKHGINPEGYLAGFSAGKLLPDLSDINALPIITGIIFIFAGVEMSSVHVNDVEEPSKNYPIGVVTAVLLVVGLVLVASLTLANAVPKGKMELSDIMYCVNFLVEDAGLPSWFDEVLAACILIGTLVTLSSWILGPSKTMLKVAQEGNLPPVFQKTNSLGVPVTLVIVQAIFVSVIALLFVLIPNVDEVFLIINVTTMLLYCAVYVLLCASGIKLRRSMPNLKRDFRLGKSGDGMMYAVAGIGLVVVIGTMLIGLILPEGLSMSAVGYAALQIGIVFVFILIALVIHHNRKPEWKL